VLLDDLADGLLTAGLGGSHGRVGR
jgi:hypothetical protein